MLCCRCDEQRDCNDGSDEEDCDGEDPLAEVKRMDAEIRAEEKARKNPKPTTTPKPTTPASSSKTTKKAAKKKVTKKKIQTTTPYLPDNLGDGPDLTDEEAQILRDKRKTELKTRRR